jgi:coenzyme Q-binding protein COQ10
MAPREVAFDVIADFERYSEFLRDVTATSIERAEGNVYEVLFQIRLIRRFQYRLRLVLDPPSRVHWTYLGGDFRNVAGGWELEEVTSSLTLATYSLALDVGMLIPPEIGRMLVQVRLPALLQSYKTRIEEMYRRNLVEE